MKLTPDEVRNVVDLLEGPKFTRVHVIPIVMILAVVAALVWFAHYQPEWLSSLGKPNFWFWVMFVPMIFASTQSGWRQIEGIKPLLKKLLESDPDNKEYYGVLKVSKHAGDYYLLTKDIAQTLKQSRKS